MDAAEQRITALEIEIADLKRRLAPPAPKKPAPVVEEGTRVFYPTSAATEMPTAAEMETLRRLVLARYPKLAPETRGRWCDMDAREFETGFVSAFRWFAIRGRSAEVNHKVSISYWIDTAEEWARAAQCSTAIPGDSLLCAMLAWGDIAYVEGDNAGNVWTLSLSTHGDGRMPTAASWRRVLSTGNTMPPSVGRFKDQPSPARVRISGRVW